MFSKLAVKIKLKIEVRIKFPMKIYSEIYVYLVKDCFILSMRELRRNVEQISFKAVLRGLCVYKIYAIIE